MVLQANLFQVVTFASDPMHGNPAFVLSGVRDTSDRVLVKACAMLHADVIAVIGEPSDGATSLRFFTEVGPHAGAGHATLAAAHVVLRDASDDEDTKERSITFSLANGNSQTAHLEHDRVCVDFPAMPSNRVDRVADLTAALGAPSLETWVAPFGYVAIYGDAATVAGIQPDLARVSALDRGAVIATAPAGQDSDIVIRVFAPKMGLPEDPVCGTAHRIVVPYWAKRMGKKTIHSRQLSQRGGDLWCEDKGETVSITGETSLVIQGTLRLPDE